MILAAPQRRGIKKLTAPERRTLRTLMNSAGLTQDGACKKLKIKPTALCMALNEREAKRGLPPQTWSELFELIGEALAQYLKTHPGMKTAQDIANLERQRAALVRHIFGSPTPRINHPGAVITSDALDFITLKIEDRLKSKLLRGGHFSVLVVGPVQSGRTSLMRRLVIAAEDAGIQTHQLDFGSSDLFVRQGLEIEALYERTFLKLSCPFDRLGGVSKWQQDFERWAELNWISDSPFRVCLFLEGLERLGKDDVSRTTIIVFLAWLNSLRVKPAFKHFQIVSIFSPYDENHFSKSPFHQEAGHNETLGFFDKLQCVEFAQRYGLRDPERAGEVGYNYFGGQPFLIHLFMYGLRERGWLASDSNKASQRADDPLKQELKDAKEKTGLYGRYWNAVTLFLDAASQGTGYAALQQLIRSPKYLTNEQSSWLRLAGAIVPGDPEVVVPPFVKNALGIR